MHPCLNAYYDWGRSEGENYVRRSKVPVLKWRSETHSGWNPNERKLVA